MTGPPVLRIDREHPRVRAAAGAEQRLFAHYQLHPREHRIPCSALDLTLRAVECGEGAPLILIPGGGGELFQFIPTMPHLAGHRLIAVDLPGGGLSDTVDHRQVDMRTLAREALQSVLDAFELDAAPFLTNSRGAQWTFWFAQAYPERVARMVHTGCPALILGTSAPLPMRLLSVPGLNRVIFRLANPRWPDQVKSTLKMLGTSEQGLDALPAVFFETACAMFNLPNYRLAWLSFLESMLRLTGPNPRYVMNEEDLREIRQAVDLIWGRNDPFGNLDIAARVAEALPDATLREMDAGHVPPFDDPAECARLAREALA